MAIYFEPHTFKSLDVSRYNGQNKASVFAKDLRESLSTITLAERCNVPHWEILHVLKKFGMEKNQIILKGFLQPDTHFPNEDKVAYALALKYLKQSKVDFYLNIGDVDDCASLARFNEGKKRVIPGGDPLGARLAELEYFDEKYQELLVTLPKECKYKILTMGNHDQRPWGYYEKFPENFGLSDILHRYNLREEGWLVYPEHTWARVGKVHFTHSTFTNMYAMAKTCDYGFDSVSGHLHTREQYTKTVNGISVTAQCIGHLADMKHCDYTYMHKRPNRWVSGFGEIHIDLISGNWSLHYFKIENGKLVKKGLTI